MAAFVRQDHLARRGINRWRPRRQRKHAGSAAQGIRRDRWREHGRRLVRWRRRGLQRQRSRSARRRVSATGNAIHGRNRARVRRILAVESCGQAAPSAKSSRGGHPMTAPPAGALEACPFCGAPGELLGSDVMWPLVIATCSGDCELMPSTHPASEADAIAAWNRRTHGPALLAALRLREWRPIAEVRPSGRYLVASREGEVREARWMSKRYRWVFPSAQSAFDPIAFRPMPPPPTADDLARVLEESATGGEAGSA